MIEYGKAQKVQISRERLSSRGLFEDTQKKILRKQCSDALGYLISNMAGSYRKNRNEIVK